MKFKSTIVMIAMIVLILPQMVLADADIAVQPAGTPTLATAHVDLCVVVPEILIFGVGALGDNIAKICWNCAPAGETAVGNNQTYSGPAVPPFTAPAPFSGTANVSSITDGGTGATGTGTPTATLPVYLFSNNGSDVTITATVAGGTTGGGTADVLETTPVSATSIPVADFSTSGAGGAILHPPWWNGGSQTADTAHTSGIVNLASTWTYTYIPSTIPAAGTYEGRVTYVAAQP